jgi:hypothetical protein
MKTKRKHIINGALQCSSIKIKKREREREREREEKRASKPESSGGQSSRHGDPGMRRKEHNANSPGATVRWVPDERRRSRERERESLAQLRTKKRRSCAGAGGR